MASVGVYWVGADGNVYTRTGNTVTNQGKPVGQTYDNGFATLAAGSRQGYTKIADPNPPTATSTAPAGGATTQPLNTGAVNNTQSAIDQIGPILQAALQSENNEYTNNEGSLDSQQADQQKAHDAGTVTNEQNYDANYMDSIRAGIKGLGGLMALLRGTGAAGGSVEKQVQDVVGGQTSDDIRTGADTQKENQTSLDSTLGDFLTSLKQKHAAADDTHANNVAAINRDSETQLQNLYSQLAGYYGSAGDTSNADDYMSKAGALTPSIGNNSKTQTTVYDQTPVPVKTAPITAFAAPTQPNVVTAPSNSQIGSGIFTISPATKRKDNNTPVLAPAGA